MSKDTIQQVTKLVSAVNELVKMNLMQELTEQPYVYVVSDILKMKDVKYMKNWCQNVLRVWALTYRSKVKDVNSVVLSVFDKESGELLCRYSERNGLIFS